MTMQGKKHSEETKKLMSQKAMGNKSFTGKRHTETTKLLMSKNSAHARKGMIPWNKKYKTKEEKYRIDNLKKNFGITVSQYDEILKIQNGVCAICLKAETRKHQNGVIVRLSVDHHHETGKIRGLLCSKCNIAIGQFDDNPYLCERASKYLLTN